MKKPINLLVDDSRRLGLKLDLSEPKPALIMRVTIETDQGAWIEMTPRQMLRIGKRLVWEAEKLLEAKG